MHPSGSKRNEARDRGLRAARRSHTGRGACREIALGLLSEDDVPDIERDLPESVRAMIQRKVDQLSREDHDLLIGASVQGFEFDATILRCSRKGTTRTISNAPPPCWRRLHRNHDRDPTTRAGIPTAIDPAGTVSRTTALAPLTAT